MLVSSMTAMQVLSESRDIEELWLARAAPRRWYAAGFSVTNGPTRYGNISFAVAGKPSPDLSIDGMCYRSAHIIDMLLSR